MNTLSLDDAQNRITLDRVLRPVPRKAHRPAPVAKPKAPPAEAPKWTYTSGQGNGVAAPPRDGEWFEAMLSHPLGQRAVQFDLRHGRFYDGRGLAVAEASIQAWRRG